MEEVKTCLMANQKEDEITSYFSYQDLFHIFKKLTKEISKLEQIVFTSKDTISFLKLKNKNLLKEIENLKERQYDLIQNFSSSHEVLDESIKCDLCDILKNKIDDLQKTPDKFSKGRDNLNLLLGNQKESYKKVGLGYEPKNNSKSLIKICNAQSTSKCKILKCS